MIRKRPEKDTVNPPGQVRTLGDYIKKVEKMEKIDPRFPAAHYQDGRDLDWKGRPGDGPDPASMVPKCRRCDGTKLVPRSGPVGTWGPCKDCEAETAFDIDKFLRTRL
jgi:hypothetical protein